MLRTPYNLLQRMETRATEREAEQQSISQLVACFGKSTFESHAQAESVANRHRKGKQSGGFVPYHCRHCGQYHLSRRSGGNRKINNSKPRYYDTDD